MINNKILGLIGLSAKAGKICFGSDSVENEIKSRKVKLVIVAKDCSERTKQKFQRISNEANVSIIITENIETLSKQIPILVMNSRFNSRYNFNNTIRVYSWYDIYSKINKLKIRRKNERD